MSLLPAITHRESGISFIYVRCADNERDDGGETLSHSPDHSAEAVSVDFIQKRGRQLSPCCTMCCEIPGGRVGLTGYAANLALERKRPIAATTDGGL